MNTPPWDAAIRAWMDVLGADHVEVGEGGRMESLCGFSRDVPAVLRPGGVDEVQACVRIAAREGTPLHAFSTGFNWGLGSRLPVRDGVALLDLSRLDRIREVNLPHHYAVVEPGVSQRRLYRHLVDHDLPLMVNVTGSAADSSLIGNALERGIGYFSSRADSLSGMEVVLGDGEILRTGFGHLPQSKITHSYRYGIGPSLDGLFVQSNLGIVTAAGIDLMPRPEASAAAVIKLRTEAELPGLIDRLAELRRAGILRHVVHVGNRARTRITLVPLIAEQLEAEGEEPARAACRAAELFDAEQFGPWSALAGVMGPAGVVRALRREVATAFRGVAEVSWLSERRIERARSLLGAFRFLERARGKSRVLEAVATLHGLSTGVPTDAAMHGVTWPVEQTLHPQPFNPDRSHSGMLYALPFCPMTGQDACLLVDLINRTFAEHGFEPYVTLNLVDAKSMEGVISLAFDRRHAEQSRAAHQCMDLLLDRLIETGYLPYRLGVQSMDRMIDPHSPYWQRIRALKEIFDPDCILAPGRYNLV